jgi:hypothetical protein
LTFARDESAGILRFRAAIAAGSVLLAGWRLQYALKYNPNWDLQPRVPKDNPDGGQWGKPGALIGGEETLLAQAESGRNFNVDLLEEEATGGHTIIAHIGRSRESLLGYVRSDRLRTAIGDFPRYRDGSFGSVQAANRLVNATLSRNSATVEQVALGLKRDAFLIATFQSKTGIEAFRSSSRAQPYIRDTFGVGVYIVQDTNGERGFRVATAFPMN